MDQKSTPLFNQLVIHSEKDPDSFHVPGHKNGKINLGREKPYFDSLMKLDVTELSDLDDLHSPEGVIREAENLLADLYKVKKSYFLVNGSTVGNLAMIMATLKPGDIVLVQRNCHKSVFNGIDLAGATPVYLGPEVDEELKIASGVSVDTVKTAINSYPNAKAIIVTYPNYYGVTNDLKEIISISHKNKIPVLVDEAHGAHFIASNKFPPSAVELGADIVVQSAHKTLPALTMGSYLHVNSQYITHDSVSAYLRMLQSSSPSYPIMASLDIARSYLGTYSNVDVISLLQVLSEFRIALSDFNGIKVVPDRREIDPLKISIQSITSLTGFELQALLEQEGVYTELADPYNVLFVMPLLKKGMSINLEQSIEKIHKALLKIDKNEMNKHNQFVYSKAKISRPVLNKLQMEQLSTEYISIDQAEGYICAEMLIPYPPGIPLLIQGESVEQEDVIMIRKLLEKGARFQGGASLKEGKLKVFKLG